MTRAHKQNFTVFVYRPNGWLFAKIPESATTAQVAIARAKKAIYQRGHLAHFYTYVPKLN